MVKSDLFTMSESKTQVFNGQMAFMIQSTLKKMSKESNVVVKDCAIQG